MFLWCGRGSCRGQTTRREFVAAKSGFVTEDQAPRAKTHAWSDRAALESPTDYPQRGKHVDSATSRIPSGIHSSNGIRPPPRPAKPPPYSEAVSFVPGSVLPVLSNNTHEDTFVESLGKAKDVQHNARKLKVEGLHPEGGAKATKEQQQAILTRSGLEDIAGELSLAAYEARAFGWPRRSREGSVDGESVRPTWMPETESVTSGYTVSALSRWPGENGSVAEWGADSVAAESVRPRWMEGNGSEVDASARHVFQSAWTDETETSTMGSRTPGPFNDAGFSRVESLAPKSKAAAWMEEGVKSQRPSWIAETTERTDKKTPLRGAAQKQDRSGVSEAMAAGPLGVEITIGKELREAADYKYFHNGFPGEAKTRKGLSSPKGTMGGQSSSEDAARPWTETGHPTQDDLSKQSAEDEDKDTALHQQPYLQDSHLATEAKNAVSRRIKNAEHARRHTTSPNHRPVKDSENAFVDILKAQPPRQPTAEDPRKVRISRSTTAPMSDCNDHVLRSKWIPLPPMPNSRAVSSSSSSSGEHPHAQPRPHNLAGASPARRIGRSSSPSPMGSRTPSRSSSPAPVVHSTPVMRRANKPMPQKQRKSSSSPSPARAHFDKDKDNGNASASRTLGKPTQGTPIGGRQQGRGGRGRVTDKPQVSFAGIESSDSDESSIVAKTIASNNNQPQARKSKRQRPVHDNTTSNISINNNASDTNSNSSNSSDPVDSKPFFMYSKSRGGTKTPDRVKVRTVTQPSTDPTATASTAGEKSRTSTSPGVRIWPRAKDQRGETATLTSQQNEGGKGQGSGNSNSTSNGPSRASPLSKPLLSIGRRGRFTPYLRRRLTPDLESVEEETIPASSPVKQKPSKQTTDSKIKGRQSTSTESSDRDDTDEGRAPRGLGGLHNRRRDNTDKSRVPRSESATVTLTSSTKTTTLKAPAGTAPRAPPQVNRRRLPSTGSKDDLLLAGSPALTDGRDPDVEDLKGIIYKSGGHISIPEGGDEDHGIEGLKQRSKRLTALLRGKDDSNRSRRKGSQRLSRSSSLDEWTDQHMPPRAMFSPNRFNPDAGVLSWTGSLDGSWCDSSVRSFMTGGSSASLLSARGPSDRKIVAPQLSHSEKHEVARLKFDRADVHFGYRPVRGSQRVYKAELYGEMRAAKVINMLKLPKEAVPEVLETFDAELLSLARLNNPNIVKVYGASVCPAEIIVVSEFVEGGTLRDLLNNAPKLKRLYPRERLSIARDVADGMKSLYAHGMQHRYLTSKVILLTACSIGTTHLQAKVFGVGLSMTMETIAYYNDEEPPQDQADEHLLWASREVLAGAGFSEKSDVYSFGIVLWEIMQADGSLPYDGLRQEEVVAAKYNGRGPRIPRDTPEEISSLMESCWSNLPANRPSFDKICELLTGLHREHNARDSRFDDGSFDGAMSVP